ncbi:MAG: DNA topoisomerase, partial [Bacteroidota bacterium]
MSKNLVIVESPAKAKTIEGYLGKDFTVKSSFGHVRDLSTKDLGIEVNNHFRPVYEVMPDKKKVISELKKLADSAETVWLATDEDREGEAISWHLAEVLNLDQQKTNRIVFHEITKSAITEAIKSPRKIDQNLVNAQQARRVLDRLVGFELSPILWKKVKPSLSAGRVQSVAVKLIVEREEDIRKFESTFAYKVSGLFEVNNEKGNATFKADLPKRFPTLDQARDFLTLCAKAAYSVADVEKKPGKRSPAP